MYLDILKNLFSRSTVQYCKWQPRGELREAMPPKIFETHSYFVL